VSREVDRTLLLTGVDYATINPNEHPEWDTYPDAAGAQRRIGCTDRNFRRYQEKGQIKRWLAPDESYRYLPAQVEAVAKEYEAKRVKQGFILNGYKSATDSEQAHLLRQLMAHNEAMFKSSNAATTQFVTLVLKDAQELHKTNQQLVAKLVEQTTSFVAATERLLSESTSRDLAVSTVKNQEDRAAFFQKFLFDNIAEISKVFREGSTGKAKVAAELFASIAPEVRGALRISELLTPEQLALLDKLEGVASPTSVAKPNGKTTTVEEKPNVNT
jgi:hypothetical protein